MPCQLREPEQHEDSNLIFCPAGHITRSTFLSSAGNRLLLTSELTFYYTARWLAAAQCIVIGPVCGFVCLWVCGCVFVDLIPRQLEITCIDLHQTGFVGKGSDHLQLIKFWPSRAPGEGSVAGRKFLARRYYSQLGENQVLDILWHSDWDPQTFFSLFRFSL